MVARLFSVFVIMIGMIMIGFVALIPFAIVGSIIQNKYGVEASRKPVIVGLYIAGIIGLGGGCIVHEMLFHKAEFTQKLIIHSYCNAGLGVLIGGFAGVILVEIINTVMQKVSTWIESHFETKKPFKKKLEKAEQLIVIILSIIVACSFTIGLD